MEYYDDDDSVAAPAPLSPPRPFFLADRDRASSASDRSSWSAPEDSSDSDIQQQARDAALVAQPHSQGQGQGGAVRPRPPRAHQHQRRRSSMATPYTPLTPAAAETDPFHPAATDSTSPAWSPASLYREHDLPSSPPSSTGHGAATQRGPPTSYVYPFQSYPGNPDPIPSRPSSAGSFRLGRRDSNPIQPTAQAAAAAGVYAYEGVPTQTGSQLDLARPYAPFMAGQGPSIYGGSAAATLHRSGSPAFSADPAQPGVPLGAAATHIPRVSTSASFRAPFLSPASRPSSSIWSPPSYAHFPMLPSSPTASSAHLALPKPKAPLPSTRLPNKLDKADKPWLSEREPHTRTSKVLTLLMLLIGVGGAAALCYSGYSSVPVMKNSQLCLVFEDDFDSLDTTNNWNQDIEMSGFGNGEFQMTTGASTNIYTQNSQLYIMPTLTSAVLDGGYPAVLDGGSYSLSDCTTDNTTACSATSSNSDGSTIPPVQSARINTYGKQTLQYGRVEVRAKLPSGDWLWPAIWMLPEDNTYGPWPLSGEIDIMEARGNGITYPGQGSNFVRSSLNYGPMTSLVHTIFGWWTMKRETFAADFHVYGLEWDSTWMRFYVDSRLDTMLDLRMRNYKQSFWARAGFPETAQNGSTQVVVDNIYDDGNNAAPFDQSFYMILDLAVGGTSGFFPDNVGGKMWYDGSATAMRDFASAQAEWYATWPEDADDRAFRVDYVKMWKLC